MRAIVGLGNPGVHYASTRHNVGFWVVDLLARRHTIPLDQLRYSARYGQGEIRGVPVLLVQPMTYMNRSGEAVDLLLDAYHLTPQQILVVCDDIALPLGKLRLRTGGSDGGHRGLRSIITELGTEAFPRLRVGIGAPPEGMDPADYVLSPFEEAEKPLISQMLEHAADACEAWLTEPIEQVMNRFNRSFLQE
ncbi:MAG: aminoacyl-tRNA hydrolase [Fimbriimonadales bacterium]|nr:aminoacyl-tRNA hydrolase [Fimbriimonadales bacterium]